MILTLQQFIINRFITLILYRQCRAHSHGHFKDNIFTSANPGGAVKLLKASFWGLLGLIPET